MCPCPFDVIYAKAAVYIFLSTLRVFFRVCGFIYAHIYDADIIRKRNPDIEHKLINVLAFYLVSYFFVIAVFYSSGTD